MEEKPPSQSPAQGGSGCGGYLLWGSWVLVSAVGMGIGWALGWRLSFLLTSLPATLVIGGVSGGMLGLAQSLALIPVARARSLWILASALGWALGFFVGSEVAYLWGLTEFAFGAAIGTAVGLALGLAQWLVLRAKGKGNAWWILASWIGWSISLIAYQPGVNLMGMVYGGVPAMSTGLAVVWLAYGANE